MSVCKNPLLKDLYVSDVSAQWPFQRGFQFPGCIGWLVNGVLQHGDIGLWH